MTTEAEDKVSSKFKTYEAILKILFKCVGLAFGIAIVVGICIDIAHGRFDAIETIKEVIKALPTLLMGTM